jgi:hypothetical protein
MLRRRPFSYRVRRFNMRLCYWIVKRGSTTYCAFLLGRSQYVEVVENQGRSARGRKQGSGRGCTGRERTRADTTAAAATPPVPFPFPFLFPSERAPTYPLCSATVQPSITVPSLVPANPTKSGQKRETAPWHSHCSNERQPRSSCILREGKQPSINPACAPREAVERQSPTCLY